MKSISQYLSLVKFSHTLFALPFAVIGFILAVRQTDAGFSWTLFSRVLLCMVFARSAAMAFNRYIDKDIDSRNPRTAMREIPAGIIPARSALALVIVTSLLFVATCYFINTICFVLSPVALFVILGYSYTKRFTALCHIVLGVGLALAPIGAYLTLTGSFAVLPLMYSFLVLFWVSGFDIIYALQDAEFDRSYQLRSIPALIGVRRSLQLSSLLHVGAALLIVFAGMYGGFGLLYWIGSLIFLALLVYQHTIVKPDDLSRVNMAFGTLNGIASVIFGIFVALELLLK